MDSCYGKQDSKHPKFIKNYIGTVRGRSKDEINVVVDPSDFEAV